MDIYTALAYVVLGALLGAIGQCARVIVGIKKHLDEAFKIEERKKEFDKREDELDKKLREAKQGDKELIIKEKELILKKKDLQWFKWDKLITSLLIALVVGGVAGVLGAIAYLEKPITPEFMITLIAIGYAGTDFIEGFMKTRVPK